MIDSRSQLPRGTKHDDESREPEDHGDIKTGYEPQPIHRCLAPAIHEDGSCHQAPEDVGVWVQRVDQGSFENVLRGLDFYMRQNRIEVFPGFVSPVRKI